MPNTTQLETFKGVDLQAFTLQMRNKAGINVVEAITDANIRRTIEGASTLTVTVEDDNDRTIQKSGKLGRKVDVNVDGLWFTLVAISKQQRQLTLTFEDRVVNALRYYDSWKFASRGKMTRAQFVLGLIKEVTEFPVHYVIPELNKQFAVGAPLLPGEVELDASGHPIITTSPEARPTGIPAGVPLATALTVKGATATPEQINNADIVLQTGVSLGARRKVLVCSIMTAIQESEIKNLTGGDRDSVGIFQQRPSQGWPASRNIPVDATAFFNTAIALDKANPNMTYNDLCQAVQHSGFPNAYGPHQPEAEAFVNAFGISGNDAADDPSVYNNSKPVTPTGKTPATQGATVPIVGSGDYQFYRGNLTQDPDGSGNFILKKQNSWDCMQGLADQVNWRCFCVSGFIYFISEQYLFRSKPFMTISEDSEGIDWIDFDYDEGKRVATVNVTAHIAKWSAPPGSVIQIVDSGTVNGRWLVNDVARSIYNTIGTITLKKPRPILPEPIKQTIKTVPFGEVTQPPTPNAITPSAPPIAGASGGKEQALNETQALIVNYAKRQMGLPYAYGTESPGVSFDCSGLSQAAYDAGGVLIPRVAQDQYNAGPIIFDYLQPADLVFFDSDHVPPQKTAVGHVGIYIGNGNFIHAPHTGDKIKVSSLTSTWYHDHYVGATRAWT